jgi:signal transduction histidine kinase
MRLQLVRAGTAQPWGEASGRARVVLSGVKLVSAAGPAATIILSDSFSPEARVVAWAITIYATARAFFRSEAQAMIVADAMIASTAIAFTGNLSSPLMPFGLAVSVTAGLGGGFGAGMMAGIIVTASSVPALAREAGLGLAALNHTVTWSALFPLSGVAAGLARKVWNAPSPQRAAENERRRIARDLHDGVAQTLAHLRLELDMLSRPEFSATSDPEGIARLARVAERTLADVRSIIQDLTPPPPPGGLIAALTAYIADVATSHGPRVTLETRGEIPVDHPASSQLFRIAQEAISNAVRHAEARNVLVLLERIAGGTLRLTVEDDGVGIADPAGRPGGLGLPAMRERSAAMGSTCSIAARPGGGTRIVVDTPATLMRIA